MANDWITPDWPAPTNVRAVSTTRAGGVSRGVYASFNLARHVGDDARAVAENRQHLHTVLGLRHEPCWLKQVHGAHVATIDHIKNPLSPTRVGERARRIEDDEPAAHRPAERAYMGVCPGLSGGAGVRSLKGVRGRAAATQENRFMATADAAITQSTDEACVVMTADCLPVLFCDRAGRTVAAAHAGWRGLVVGVLEATISALRTPPEEILAWLGPAIGPEAYEVGEEVRAALISEHPEADEAFEPVRAGKWLCDLYLLASQRLRQAGVRYIYGGGFCTYSERERFFSYRRDGECGRMASLIWLTSASPLPSRERAG